jgi:glycosyltransferase involved in cell wall biosynthesis
MEISPINQFFGWVTRASAAAMEILSDRKIDVIMTTSSPFESHLVGLELKRKTGLPWIASFSDPWPISFAPVPYYTRGLPVIGEMSRYLAKKVMHKCDVIHMPSPYGVEWTEKISGVPITDKSVTIPHIGSCASDAESPSNHVGWLAHVGDLSRERASQALLAGVKKAHHEIPNRFKGLLCVGKVCPKFKEMAHQMGMDDIVKLTGQLSAAEAMKISCSATALIVIEADMAISPYLPSKFADYVVIGKPLITVSPQKSLMRDYLSQYGGGVAVKHVPDEIASAILDIFTQGGEYEHSLRPHESGLKSLFMPQVIAGQYLKMFHELLYRSKENGK